MRVGAGPYLTAGLTASRTAFLKPASIGAQSPSGSAETARSASEARVRAGTTRPPTPLMGPPPPQQRIGQSRPPAPPCSALVCAPRASRNRYRCTDWHKSCQPQDIGVTHADTAVRDGPRNEAWLVRAVDPDEPACRPVG